jgi:hypothetical protein
MKQGTNMTPAIRNDGDDLYMLSGKIIRDWVKLELSLSLWLPDLLGVDEVRSRVLWNSYGDLRSKLNLLRTLIRNFADEGSWQEAKAILSDVDKLAEDRYILAHTFGDVDEVKSKLRYYSDKTDGDFVLNFVEEKTVDSDNVKDWLKAMGETRKSIAEFTKKLGGGVHKTSLLHRRSSNPKSSK